MFNVVHTIELGAGAREFLASLVLTSESSNRLIQIEKLLTEIKNNMLTQTQVDQLTAALQAVKAEINTKIVAEGDEVKAAIASKNVNTTALEAELASIGELGTAVDNIYTPPIDTPVEPPA